MLERKIASVGLITTRGFRDVLELGRRTRPTPYGLEGPVRAADRAAPAARGRRADRCRGRRAACRSTRRSVEAAAKQLLALGAESVVIHFLHSYVNPAHEARAAEIVRALWPNRYVTAGHTRRRRVPRVRARHDGGGERRDPAGAAPLHRAAAAASFAARGFSARPAGDAGQRRHGVVDDRRRARGRDRDVGAGVGRDRRRGDGDAGRRAPGRVRQRRHLRHGRHLERRGAGARRPCLRSRATSSSSTRCRSTCRWSTSTRSAPAAARSPRSMRSGMLRVGPESAGATPGPICYGRGGTRPTITDANVVLGRLDPDRLLAVEHGGLAGDDRARRSSQQVGAPLGLDATAAAAGDRPRRQRQDGRRDPHGEPGARPRPARLRPVRVRRRRAAARRGAGARARASRRC